MKKPLFREEEAAFSVFETILHGVKEGNERLVWRMAFDCVRKRYSANRLCV
jgi:hypothetical protein